jgi:hypothetical protein
MAAMLLGAVGGRKKSERKKLTSKLNLEKARQSRWKK